VRDHESLTGELIIEAGTEKCFEPVPKDGVDLPVQDAVASVDEPAGIAVRAV
jgi:hypothetical protein